MQSLVLLTKTEILNLIPTLMGYNIADTTGFPGLESERARMRADLLRAVSHDLRTPLTSIAGSADLLLENADLPEESRRELLGSIKDDSQWLIRMVENLLSITRVGGENASIQKSAG